jgi:hypothetical protein
MATIPRNLGSRGSLMSAGAPTRIAQALLFLLACCAVGPRAVHLLGCSCSVRPMPYIVH